MSKFTRISLQGFNTARVTSRQNKIVIITYILFMVLSVASIVFFYKMNDELKTQVNQIVEYNTQLIDHVHMLEQRNRSLMEENNILKQKVEEMEEFNRRHPIVTSRSFGNVGRAKQILDGFEVTWYNDDGVTASGRPTVSNWTVAVDPNVIPLGSRLLLVLPDGREYNVIAADTGGAVKGNIIDIYEDVPDSVALRNGRVDGVKVYVLS